MGGTGERLEDGKKEERGCLSPFFSTLSSIPGSVFQLSLGGPCPWTLTAPPPPFDLQRTCASGVLVFQTPGLPHCIAPAVSCILSISTPGVTIPWIKSCPLSLHMVSVFLCEPRMVNLSPSFNRGVVTAFSPVSPTCLCVPSQQAQVCLGFGCS